MQRKVLILVLAVISCYSDYVDAFPEDSKIIGGKPVDIKDYPYQLFLNFTEGYCGASIINSNWALTAAHCVSDVENASLVTFRAGSSNSNSGGSIHTAINIIIHPKYETMDDYDIAVVQVTPNFPLGTPGINKVKLATTEAGTFCSYTVSGWGRTSYPGGTRPTILQAATLVIQPRLWCFLRYFSFTPRMVCAQNSDRNVCSGDSGGPLVDRSTNTQYGIVSKSNCVAGSFSYFTNVANLRSWVLEQIASVN